MVTAMRTEAVKDTQAADTWGITNDSNDGGDLMNNRSRLAKVRTLIRFIIFCDCVSIFNFYVVLLPKYFDTVVLVAFSLSVENCTTCKQY